MLTIKPTKKLMGVTIQGDYNDLQELQEAIYRMCGENDIDDPHYSIRNRLLGLCYDIRHAYQGDRDVELKDNAFTKELSEWHEIKADSKNVYYSVDVLFTEALFIAITVPSLFEDGLAYYGSKRKLSGGRTGYKYSYYKTDIAYLSLLCSKIWGALEEVLDTKDFEKLMKLYECSNETYENYAAQYVEKLSRELDVTAVEKRKSKLNGIAKRLITKTNSYYAIEEFINDTAKECRCHPSALMLDIPYPETID